VVNRRSALWQARCLLLITGKALELFSWTSLNNLAGDLIDDADASSLYLNEILLIYSKAGGGKGSLRVFTSFVPEKELKWPVLM